jgi:Zn finger protein HypA/HybF involved in hydrogenase expression
MRRACTKDKVIDTRNVATCGEFIGQVEMDQTADEAISRRAAIDAVNIGNLHPGIVGALQSILAELPPVTPKQRTGHWIECEEEVKCFCSECKEISDYPTQFCPNCGAKMEVDA